MRILIVNPNSSEEMTASIRGETEHVARQGTEVTVVRVEEAPPSISSVADEALAAPGVMRHARWAAEEGYDAVIVACFSDPGLGAARDAAGIPVFGIQETSLYVAAMLGRKFTVLTPLARRVPKKLEDVRKLGLSHLLASVRPLELSVEETDGDPQRTKQKVVEVARRAVEEDEAELIVLGCAGMVGYAEETQRRLGVPVMDPTTVTLSVCEGLGERQLNALSTSRVSMPGFTRGEGGDRRGQ
ncbi:MAG: aspartate/glutamate racemase family protein [Candidatus Bipolaricaulota bacterium]